MQRFLAILLVMLLAFTVACGDDDDGDDDDGGADSPTATTATGGEATATMGGGDEASPTTGGGDEGGEGDATNGEALVASNGCTGCHSIDGSEMTGPSWQGLYGSEVELEGGETVTADDAYIRQSIQDPASQIVAGFTNLMPQLPLDDAQINDIIAYIRTLE